MKAGLLLGNAEEHEGTPYLFVDGALEMEDVTESGEKVVFTEAAWKKAYQNMEQMFPKRTILGWFLCGMPGSTLSPLNYWKQHGQYFAGKNQLMYLNFGLEGEEAVYVTSEDGFYKLRGYSIYYERNQMMQDYMIQRKDARRVESGTGDTVIRDFRQRMEENKTQAISRRGTIRVLGSLCSALSIAVLAGGVVMFNNYEKMREMESVLTSAIPIAGKERQSMEAAGKTGADPEGGADSEVIVEQAKNGITPTIPPETMSPTYPEETEGAYEVQVNQGQAQAVTEPAPPETVPQTEPAPPAPPEETQAAAPVSENPITYKVQDGETLYSICLKVYGSLSRVGEVCELNGLENPDKIISGQKLILP